jgi:hypothetical protein
MENTQNEPAQGNLEREEGLRQAEIIFFPIRTLLIGLSWHHSMYSMSSSSSKHPGNNGADSSERFSLRLLGCEQQVRKLHFPALGVVCGLGWVTQLTAWLL